MLGVLIRRGDQDTDKHRGKAMWGYKEMAISKERDRRKNNTDTALILDI